MKILNENVSRNIMKALTENSKDSELEKVILDLNNTLRNAEKFPQTKKNIYDMKKEFVNDIYKILDKQAEATGEYVHFDDISRKYSNYFTRQLKKYNIRYTDGREADNYSSPDDDPNGGMNYGRNFG